jgi:hypothetical protein
MSFSGDHRVCDGCGARQGRLGGQAVDWLYYWLAHTGQPLRDHEVRHYCLNCLHKAPKCFVVLRALTYNMGRLL